MLFVEISRIYSVLVEPRNISFYGNTSFLLIQDILDQFEQDEVDTDRNTHKIFLVC